MVYNVSNNWNTKVVGDNKKYASYLTINNTYIPMRQISKIEFIEEIIDKENEYMYVGTFRSNQMDITFKSLQNIEIASNLPVYCEIGLNTDYQAIDFSFKEIDQNGYKVFTIANSEDLDYFKEHYYVNISVNGVKYERIEILDINNLDFTLDFYQVSEIESTDEIIIYPFEYVPKGHFLIDEPEKNYHKTCKITCLDYSIKFKTPVDYSVAFTDGKITLKNLLIWLCNHYNVTLGTYPNVNNNIEIGVYDSTLSGKTYVSYIAEMFGGNVKIDRNGALNIIPLKQIPTKTINALKTKSFDLGEKFKVSKVVYQDAIRIFDPGDDTANTLYIRPENMFVPDRQAIENIYNAVKDCEIYSLSNELRSDVSIDCWDIVNYSDGENLYPTYYNNTTTYNMSLMTKVETKIPSKQQEQTTNVINANVDTKLNIVKTTIDLLNATIQLLSERIVDVSKTITGTGYIQLENAYSGTLHHLEITGDISLLFPSDDLYPSNDLYPLDTYLMVDNNKYHLDFTILRYINANVCDKYVYEDGKQWVERNVGVDSQGNLYQLSETIIETKEDLIIEVNSNSIIHLESFDNANYSCTYLLENEYTNNFATNVDLISQINLSPGNVLIEASKLAKITAEKILLEGYISANGNFTVNLDGDMSCRNANINGDLVTSKGVLTNLQFGCELWGWFKENVYNNQGGGLVGFNVENPDIGQFDVSKSFLNFTVRIPEHFTIKSAKLYLRHSPMTWDDGEGHTQQGSCKNMRAYLTTGLGTFGWGGYLSEGTNIGANPTFEPIEQISQFSFNDTSFDDTYSSEDFKDKFTGAGVYNISIMTTIPKPTITENNVENAYEILGQYTGILNGTLEIIGYTSNV